MVGIEFGTAGGIREGEKQVMSADIVLTLYSDSDWLWNGWWNVCGRKADNEKRFCGGDVQW